MKTYARILASALVAFAYAQSAQASCGVVDAVKGDVKITSPGKSTAAANGTKVCAGDSVISGADGRARLKMEDGNEINVSPDSNVKLETYQFNPAENKKKVMLNLLKGKVRTATKEENMYNDAAKDGQANSFQVRTKSAVAGVRGTDFQTSFNPTTNASSVVTFHGNVEFGQPGPNGGIKNSVHVMGGQTSTAAGGTAPQAPTKVPPGELKKIDAGSKVDAPGSTGSSGDSSSGRRNDKNVNSNSPQGAAGGSAGAGNPGSVGGSSGGPAPASVGGGMPTGPGGMPAPPPMFNVNSDGVGGNGGGPEIPQLPNPGGPPGPPLPPPPPPTVCSLCNQVVQQNGNATVTVKINFNHP